MWLKLSGKWCAALLPTAGIVIGLSGVASEVRRGLRGLGRCESHAFAALVQAVVVGQQTCASARGGGGRKGSA